MVHSAPMGSEIELKLDITAAAADVLEQSGLLGESRGHTLLHATYYDTPDGLLRAHGLTLRIRREGKRLIQTVKRLHGGTAGLFARGEWDFSVPAWTPEIDGRTPAGRVLARARGHGELAARFELVVQRCSFAAEISGSRIAVALDRGTARAQDRSCAFCELELELEEGDSAALFDLAERLGAVAPVRIGFDSKADRGFALLGPLHRAHKAHAVSLSPATSPAEACARVLAECLAHYRRNEAALLRQADPEAVHQARVALRRLRTARMVFAPLLAGKAARRLDRGLRDLARAYGEVRDIDVLLAATSEPAAHAALAAERAEAWHALARRLGAVATRRLVLGIARWATAGDWRDAPADPVPAALALEDFAAAALDKRLKRVRRHGRHLARLPEAARHQLRKDAKKLRYAAEFFSALWPRGAPAKRRRRFMEALEKLQDALGQLNDIAVEREHLGTGAPDRSARAERLLERAGAARHALLECGPFWR